MTTDSRRESELHRLAEQQGLLLRCIEQAPGEDASDARFQLVDPGDNSSVTGSGPAEFDLTLDDVERFLKADHSTPQGSVEDSVHRVRRASAESDPESSEHR